VWNGIAPAARDFRPHTGGVLSPVDLGVVGLLTLISSDSAEQVVHQRIRELDGDRLIGQQ
jgi:hypothetical protein